LGTMG